MSFSTGPLRDLHDAQEDRERSARLLSKSPEEHLRDELEELRTRPAIEELTQLRIAQLEQILARAGSSTGRA